jgi:protoporphyrinogen oxidase
MKPTVGIVGGGILGMTAAYRLAQAGVAVSLFERAPDLGGLVGAFDFDGTDVDRFYHVVLPSDDRVLGLADELGLGDRWRFRPTRVGFYGDGRLFSMTSPKEFLTFPILRPHERARLALFVARCQLTKQHDRLDDESLEEWLQRHCGKGVVEKMWKPLLDSKFDGNFADLPATYIWARTRRMGSTRDKSGREVMGWLEGGYQTLIDALEQRIVALGGEVRAGATVESIAAEGGRAVGVVVDGRLRRFDHVLCTLAPPMARRLLAPELAEQAPADHCRYLGVVCLLLRVRESVSPYYTLNITDRRIPLTTVVETTHVVDPEHVGGHLLYVSKYVQPGHADLTRPVEEIERDYRGYAQTIFPALRDELILGAVVQRAPAVEPVHLLGGERRIPPLFPLPGLALASTANVYPDNVNGQSVIGVADRVTAGILERLAVVRPLAAAA